MGRIFVLFNSVFYEAMRIAFYFDLFLILYVASIFAVSNKIHQIGILLQL